VGLNASCTSTGSYARAGLGVDSVTAIRTLVQPVGQVGAVTWTETLSAGPHTLYLAVVTSSGTGTFYVDSQRNGADADPYATFLEGEIWG